MYKTKKCFDNCLMWLVWKLPRRVVYWCGIRIWANASFGEGSEDVVGEILLITALRRWTETYEKKNEGKKKIVQAL